MDFKTKLMIIKETELKIQPDKTISKHTYITYLVPVSLGEIPTHITRFITHHFILNDNINQLSESILTHSVLAANSSDQTPHFPISLWKPRFCNQTFNTP